MNPWEAYLLGVASTFAVLLLLWLGLRVLEPWIMARAANVQIGFLHVVGMRLRKTDPRVIVPALVALAKREEPMSAGQLEAIYMTLPEDQRTLGGLLRAARPDLVRSGERSGTV